MPAYFENQPVDKDRPRWRTDMGSPAELTRCAGLPDAFVRAVPTIVEDPRIVVPGCYMASIAPTVGSLPALRGSEPPSESARSVGSLRYRDWASNARPSRCPKRSASP